MGCGMSKEKGAEGGKKKGKNSKSTAASDANSSDAGERAVRRAEVEPKIVTTNATAALPSGVTAATPLRASPQPAIAPSATPTPTIPRAAAAPAPVAATPVLANGIAKEKESLDEKRDTVDTAVTACLSPPPAPRSVSPLPSQQLAAVAATAELRKATPPPAAEHKTATPPPKTNGSAVNGTASSTIKLVPGTPERKASPEGKKPSTPVDRRANSLSDLSLERKISLTDAPPPAPTPPPAAPTPPPMPPTPPPVRGGMPSIAEDAPLPSPTFGRRPGPPRGSFGYNFPSSLGPPLGERPTSPPIPSSAPISRSSSPALPGEKVFYLPKSAPISRAASPAPPGDAPFGYIPSGPPIMRAASPPLRGESPARTNTFGIAAGKVGGGDR